MRKTTKWYYAMENKRVIDLLVEHKPEVGNRILEKWKTIVYEEATCKQFEMALEQGIKMLKEFGIPYEGKYIHSQRLDD
ncbi:hypothetical protein [Bacillus cereus]|uniref:hypothetical protein n=1 Tax=Bacillus cereus TaxID=1396 RepID=UPI001C8CDB68|nr:hypothetical protein [Bacillus cereus]MBX9158641.1 hypothetical protein [Bacillus cereus]